MSTCVLVACCAAKLSQPAFARDMYISPLFKKSRKFAEKWGDQWLILSAKHGVVQPDEIIAPYDMTLSAMNASERRAWAKTTSNALSHALDNKIGLIILAGKLYRQHLDLDFARWIGVPMKGLGIGQQLAWLNSRIDIDSTRN